MIDLSQMKVALVVLWVALGVATGFGYIWLIKKNAASIKPDASSKGIVNIFGGIFVRLIGIGIVIYLAIRMHPLYAVIFVLVFTVTQFVLIFGMGKELKKDEISQNPEKKE